jgi:hypothetical protein
VLGKSAQTASALREKRQSKDAAVLQEVRVRMEEQLVQQFAEYCAMRSQTKEEFQNHIQLVRMSINESFQEMQERHVKVLQVLELNLAAETLRAQKRPTSELQELERIAIILGDREEFAAATAFVAEARAVQAQNQSDNKHDVKLSSEAHFYAIRKGSGDPCRATDAGHCHNQGTRSSSNCHLAEAMLSCCQSTDAH